MKHIASLEECMHQENKRVSKKLFMQTDSLLYNLENIVKKQELLMNIYKNLEANITKLTKFDKDILFQIIFLNETPPLERNFNAFLEYYTNSFDN